MTIAEFIELLDSEGWYLDPDGNLSDENDECPLWHVYHRDNYDDEEEAEDYGEAGVRCGLKTRDAIAIARAADGRGHPRLRKRLLKHVGLAK